MNSDTPRTNALLEQNSCGRKEDDYYGDDWSTQDILDIVALARTLELENQQLRADLDRWKETCHQLGHDGLSVNSFHKALSENIQLRDDLKKCAGDLLKAQHEAKCEYQNKYGRECFVTRFDKTLSLPSILAALKGKG